MKILKILIVIIFFGWGSASATIINIPADYPTIQQGINASVNGDEVVIANGIYSGTGNYNISFLNRAITVRSESGNPDSCIIDVQGSFNGQVERGFIFEFGETRNSVLRDLTIINAVADAP